MAELGLEPSSWDSETWLHMASNWDSYAEFIKGQKSARTFVLRIYFSF